MDNSNINPKQHNENDNIVDLKVIINFDDPKSYDVVNYLYEERKKREMFVEFLGYTDVDLNKELPKSGLNPYFALYYANRLGISMEYTKRIFDAYYIEQKNISEISVIAGIFRDIGYDPNDIIDNLLENDYEVMHHMHQIFHQQNEIKCTPVCYKTASLKQKATTIDEIAKLIEE